MDIVIRDRGYDRLLPAPLTFAYAQASQGALADILFLLWAGRVLSVDGAQSVNFVGRHAADLFVLQTSQTGRTLVRVPIGYLIYDRAGFQLCDS